MANANTSASRAAITLSTLEKRIRRHLAGDGLQLRKNRAGTITHQSHGDWSVIEPRNHTLMRHQFTLAELGRDLGVLAEHEDVEGDSERWHEIVLKISDASNVAIPRSFKIRAAHFTKPIRDLLRDGYGPAGRDLEADADLMMQVLTGWKNVLGPDGRELEFSRENVRLLLDSFLGMSRMIVRTLLESIAKEVSHDL